MIYLRFWEKCEGKFFSGGDLGIEKMGLLDLCRMQILV